MKNEEKKRARTLRKQGFSLNEISKEVMASKGSVSLWVRDIELSRTQRNKLNKRGFSVDAIEKRRITRINNTKQRHSLVFSKAKSDVNRITKHDLWMLGVALYWGEGGKTARGLVRLSNSDPQVIRIMMRFFREVCDVPEEKFRGHVHTFSHLNAEHAEQYWAKVSGIPRACFYKTYVKPSKAGQGKKDSLPHGTFQIYVCNTNLFLTIMGWISGVYSQALKK
ncbi:MAG: hypothetical protein WDZ90_00410 [Candidatus Paceibacterota bacterium]